MSVSPEIRATVQRRFDASEEIQRDLTAVLHSLPVKVVREVAQILIEEVGYLGDHMPDEREGVSPFACSQETYHFCSFSSMHHPRCKAVGGDGEGFESPARSCEADCGETEAEPWCQVSGFECPTCERLDKLLGILRAAKGRS